jgi:tetratricopeptide (TPR) repeat protein
LKFGLRTPSFRKRISARLSFKRYIRHNLGLKAPRGLGVFTNPKKASYNFIYNRTSISIDRLFSTRKKRGESVSGFVIFIMVVILLSSFIELHWKTILIVIGLIVGFLLIFFFTFSKSKRAKNICDKAIKLHQTGQTNMAINLLKEQISKKDDFEAIDLLASLHAELNENGIAMQYFNLLLTKPIYNDMKELVSNKLSRLYLISNSPHEVEVLFKNLNYRNKNLNSDSLNIAYHLGLFFKSKGELTKAKHYFEKVVNSKIPSNQSQINLLSNEELKYRSELELR